MLQFKDNESFIQNYDGVCAIKAENSYTFLKDLFEFETKYEKNSITINNKTYSIKDCMIVNDLTKVSDLFNFTIKNYLTQLINNNENWNVEKIINFSLLNDISNVCNQKITNNFINVNVDWSKAYKNFFELNNELFVDKDIMLSWIDYQTNLEKKVIIFQNFDSLKISDLYKFTSKFHFILLTNDILKNCEKFEEFEMCSIYKSQKIYEIFAIDPILSWISNRLKKEVLKENLLNDFKEIFLDDNKYEFYKFLTN